MSENITKKKRPYVRGMYCTHPAWSKDTTNAYYQGVEMKFYWPLFRWIVLILFFLLMKFGVGLSLGFSFLCCLILIISYQKVIALIMGFHVVPSMDAATLLSSAKCHVNFVNVVHYDKMVPDEALRFNITKIMKFMPKMTQHFVEFGGEYYYKQLHQDPEKARQITFARGIVYNTDPSLILETEEDIDNWAQDNLNQKMPLDGPMWRIYVQKFKVNGKEGGIIVYKSHHSFSDGISNMCMSLAMSSGYHRSYFIKGDDAPWYIRIITRLSFPFMIPFLLWDTA